MKAPTTYPEADGWDYSVFWDAQHAIRRAYRDRDLHGSEGYEHEWWYNRYYQENATPLHPVVESFVQQWRPLNWQQLLLEWPHVSKADPAQLAYTPSQRYGEDDRQLRTSIGKYLNKHWPHVADHLRRDAVAAYSMDEMQFVHTTPEIIQGIEMGPRSCMQSGYGTIPFNERDHSRMVNWFADNENEEPDWTRHPYCVYAPEHGWHMAIRKKDGVFLGRALCLSFNGTNVFVRTYSKRSADDSQSSSDHTLEQWLANKGYEKRSEWPNGAKLLRMEHPTKGGLFAPYIDGSDTCARKVDDDGEFLVVNTHDGALTCDNTDGTVEVSEEPEPDYYCNDCGRAIFEDDDRHYVGPDEDQVVCGGCINNYTYVRGSARWGNYREYYVPDRDAVELQCGRYSIDEDNPPEGVVQLENGELAELDDTVRIDGEYYLSEDEDVVELANEWDDNTHALKDNCWQCEGSGNWYHDDDTDDQVELDDGTYHRDHLNSLVNAEQRSLPLPEPRIERVEVPPSEWIQQYATTQAYISAA